ncbi:MAG: FtsX-like permease family protein [Thermoflexales bacterium]|nr:FtsX-like permease family protein [Thermoflexales bacterium]
MILFKIGLRFFLRRPLQSILCVFGVALGVAVIIAIDLANGSASRAFALSAETVAGRSTHSVTAGEAGLDVSVYRMLRVDLGVREAAPVVDGYALAEQLDRQPIRILGIDVFAEAPFRSYLGDTGGGARNAQALDAFLTRPDTILIGRGLAQRYGLGVGSPIVFKVGDRAVTLVVAGLLEPADAASAQALDTLALMDIGNAQRLFGLEDRITRVDLILDERTAADRALLARIEAALPRGAYLEKPEARAQSVESMSDAFELNLTALSLIALLVGVFLVYNTITFSVVQRRAMIGVLRCLGVTRGQVFAMVVGEAALLSLIGGALGIFLGIVLGRGAVGLVTRTINDLFYVVNVRNVSISTASLLKGMAAGTLSAVAAAIVPAWEATSIAPVGALRRSQVESRLRGALPWVTAAGAVLIVVGVVLLGASTNLWVNFIGIFGVVVGASLFTPVVALGFLTVVRRPFGALFGLLGRMAPRAMANALSRTAVAVAALMVAVAVIIGLQAMIGSFRKTVSLWLEQNLTSDIYIRPPTSLIGETRVTLAPDKIAALAAYPGVEDVTTYRRIGVDASVDGSLWRAMTLQALGHARERAPELIAWQQSRPGGLWASMAGRDEVWVSEPLANRMGITQKNNLLRLRTPSGERTFTVVAVMYDFTSDGGAVFMRSELFTALWGDDGVSSLSIILKPEAAPRAADIVVEMRRDFAGANLVFFANRELRRDALAAFDRTFAITSALNLLATLVAFIGVLSALMALQIERTRELGVLRANGMTLGQLWRMTLLETGLLGAIAGLLAQPVGFVLGLILIYIINLRSFGWSIRLLLTPDIFLQALVVSIVSALLAAIYPMLRLRKLRVAEAVRQE